MYSTFPILLAFGIFIPVLFRITLAYFFIDEAFKRIKRLRIENTPIPNKEFFIGAIVIEIAISVLFLIGLYTQIVALVAIILLSLRYSEDRKNNNIPPFLTRYHGLLILIAFALLFLGAGHPAIDLPI